MEKFDVLTGKQEVKDYPYGRLRTTMFYEIEYVKGKGYRSVSTTINPKTGRLNKPKKSTYSKFMFMYKDPKTGFVKFAGYSPNSLRSFKDLFKIIDSNNIKLTKEQEKELTTDFVAYHNVETKAKLMYTFNTFDKSSETPERIKRLDVIHSNTKEVAKYLGDRQNFPKIVEAYKKGTTIKELIKLSPDNYDATEEEVYNHIVDKVGEGNIPKIVEQSQKGLAKAIKEKKEKQEKTALKIKEGIAGSKLAELINNSGQLLDVEVKNNAVNVLWKKDKNDDRSVMFNNLRTSFTISPLKINGKVKLSMNYVTPKSPKLMQRELEPSKMIDFVNKRLSEISQVKESKPVAKKPVAKKPLAKKESKPTINKTGYVLKDLKEAQKIEKTTSVMSLFNSKDRQFISKSNTMLFVGSLGSFMWTDGKRALEVSKYGTELKALGMATANQKEAYKRAMDRLDKDTKGKPVFKKPVAKKQESKKTEVKTKTKTTKTMAKKTASKTRVQKKTLEQLLQGNDCEKLQGVTQIVVKMMKAKENDPKKVKRLSNEASYIYNGLRSGKCEQSKIKTVKALATKAWSKIIEADEKRQLKQPFAVPSDATKFFKESLKEFGMKKQTGKAIKKLPTKLF